jgi:(p)ppGpp synthase/HD superfamily hydrolase
LSHPTIEYARTRGADIEAQALIVAALAHAEQTDKSGVPYIRHVTAVAVGAMTRAANSGEVDPGDAFVVGLLHDVVEDTDITLDDLAELFPARIIEAVDAVTHRKKNESRADYLARVIAVPIAKVVKKADVAHNSLPERMAAIPDGPVKDRLNRKRDEAVAALGGLD